MNGPLALVGGAEWTEGCTFDAGLLTASGGTEVVVLPTAAAYQNPGRSVEAAAAWFGGLGGKILPLDVLDRSAAFDETNVAAVRAARFVYLAGGSPMHLRSVLKESPLFEAMIAAWANGAVLAGSGAGADVLCDPMVDPRGGAFTVGLGAVADLAIIPRYNRWSGEKVHRTVALAPEGVDVVGVPERTALIKHPDGTWTSEGEGEVVVYVAGSPATLADLAR